MHLADKVSLNKLAIAQPTHQTLQENDMKPNYELLKDAYAIIGGIPEEKVNLERIIASKGRSLECGTVACAFGWLSMHPQFKRKLKYAGSVSGFVVNGASYANYRTAAAALFDITSDNARNIFGPRGYSDYDAKRDHRSDRDLFLHRVRRFLKDEGQL
jgi:hypothetical protein